MKPTILNLSLAAVLAASSAATALAQGYVDPNDQARYQQQLRDYQDRQDQYRDQQQRYQDRRDAYDARREAYQDQRDRWAANRDEYLRERDAYDARYGRGAWDRVYIYDNGYVVRRDADRRDYAYADCARSSTGGAVAGGVIGAIAGAALGSNIAGRGDRTAGGVIGGVAGAAIGASVGKSIADSHGPARCDSRGYYFTYDQTVPIREASNGYAGRYGYDYYRRNRCRMAVAPVNAREDDFRYVRVCPDRDGRFRITP